VDEIRRGEVWWVDLPAEPRGSEPGFRRPVVIVQDDAFNRSALATILVVAVTKNLELADLPGNVLLPRRESGLKRDCVANVSAVVTVDRLFFENPGVPLGRLGTRTMRGIDEGLALVLSL
jgi:mRNA interferase MazF